MCGDAGTLVRGEYIAIRQLDMASEPPVRQLSLSLTCMLFFLFFARLDLGGLEILELPRRQHGGPSLLEATLAHSLSNCDADL